MDFHFPRTAIYVNSVRSMKLLKLTVNIFAKILNKHRPSMLFHLCLQPPKIGMERAFMGVLLCVTNTQVHG